MASTPADKQSRPSSGSDEGGLGRLGIPPGGGPRFELALTHRSYAFEQDAPVDHNERLEFLGDAILDAVVTDLIFRDYPLLAEGEMARLRASVVNTHALADVARELGIGEHIRLGKGEKASGGADRDSLLADTFEALVGAVYLERGIEIVTEALVDLFRGRLREKLAGGERYDSKTALQEVVVQRHGVEPKYDWTASGPDHDRRWTADVKIGDEVYGSGAGRSKKEAEQQAAREALGRLETTPATAGEDADTQTRRERGPDARAS